MKKKLSSGMSVGTSSVLVTFVLLCLVTFAALSFLSANSDYKLSKQTANRMTDFYSANRMAEIYMANIEALISKSRMEAADERSYMQMVSSLFDDNDSITVDTSTSPATISYSIEVNETQELNVVLHVNYPTIDDPALIHIAKWQTQSTYHWEEPTTVLDNSESEGFLFE